MDQHSQITAQLDRALAMIPPRYPPRLRQDAYTLLFAVSSLAPEAITAQRNGASFRALRLHGTVPIFYMGTTYNIPLEIIVNPETYLYNAPIVRVTPVPGMSIPPGHRLVDSQGLVAHPYLHAWSSDSNLAQLVKILSDAFSVEPPVHSTPQGPPPAYHAASQPPPAYPRPNSASTTPPPPGARPEPERARLLTIVTNKIKRRLGDEFLPAFQREFDSASEIEARLEQGQTEINACLAKLSACEAELRRAIDSLAVTHSQAEERLHANQAATLNKGADEVTQPADTWSAQQFECVSEANAIEDNLYLLDKLLAQGSVDVKVYLKQVRDLTREHFFKIALAHKILEAQKRA